MSQDVKRQTESLEKQTPIERMGSTLADFCERWFPDAYVFAAIAVLIVAIAAFGIQIMHSDVIEPGKEAAKVATNFGKSFWAFIPFTMQMAFVVIGGYVVAVTPAVRSIINVLAGYPKTPKMAVAYVALMAMLASLLSWGFSMIFAGILMREISRRVPGIDYRAMGAACYLGLGSVWALGLSSSAALLMTTKGSIPPALLKISGVIPLELTLFTWQNLTMIVVLIVISVWICYASAPNADRAKTAEMAGIVYQESTIDIGSPQTPAEKLEFSPLLTIVIVLLGGYYLFDHFARSERLATALDLNTYNLMVLTLGMLLHWKPRAFLRAAAKAVPMTGGVLLQFPLYAGIFGMLMGSGLNEILAHFFVSVSTQSTLPLIGGIYSAILGLFLPSGGGKWLVEAPYILQAANELQVNLAWMVQVYNAAEALPNFINPFWMLPLMGLTGVKARDLAGYSTLQLIFHTPAVFFMLWILGLTMPYVPPMLS